MDPALGGIVGGMIPQSVPDGVGAEIDDPAVGIGPHFRNRMPGAPQDGPQVAIDRGPQRLRRMFDESLDDAAAGIVHQDIQPAEPLDRQIDCRFRNAFRRQITGMTDNLGSKFLAEMLCRLFELRTIHVRNNQFRTVARQPLRDRKANASGGAGDNGDVVFQFLIHCLPCFHRMMLTRPWARRPSLSSRQRFSLIRKVPSHGTRRYLLLPKYVSVTPSLVR